MSAATKCALDVSSSSSSSSGDAGGFDVQLRGPINVKV